MSATSQTRVFLREIEENPQPGPYADAISAAENAGTGVLGYLEHPRFSD